MFRTPFAVLSAALLLSGCVPPPCGGPYSNCGPAGPQQPVAVAPGYAYPSGGPAYGQPYPGPDGLTYLDGYPVDNVDGGQAPYVFEPALGGWGYYDGLHRWRGARPEMRERLEQFHPGGRGLPPPGFGGGARQGFGGPGFGGSPGRPDFRGFPGGRPGGPPPGRPSPADFQSRPRFGNGPPGPQGRQGPPPGAAQHPPRQPCQAGQPRC